MNRVLCFAMLATACFADIAPPPPRGTPTSLVIHSEEASAFSLRIPADLLPKTSVADVRMRSVIGGALLSLAVVMAGMVLVRWKRGAALAVAALALAGAGAIVADMPPPRRNPPPPNPLDPGGLTELRRVLDTDRRLSGNIVVQIVPAGEPLTLIVPGPREPRFRPH